MVLFSDFLLSALAGAAVSIGGAVFLSLESKVLGALFFSIGLFMVCTMGLHLFTGKVCYSAGQPRGYTGWLALVWLGNLAGAQAVASALRLTRIGAALSEKAAALCQIKTGDTLLSLFILGIFCNMMIYAGVESYKSCPHEAGKYIGMVLGVVVFLLCGFEHCVADMFYFAMAGAWSPRAAICLVIITLGNAAGGLLIPACRKTAVKV